PDRCVISNFVARPAQQFNLYSLWYHFDPLCVVDSLGIALVGSFVADGRDGHYLL
ncbi:hypothetical protein ACHAWX_000516, partial [Stephanocyclus meneghinianus]